MAFSPFNLLGTSVSVDPSRGPLGELYSNQQSTNLLKYPIDLGDKADRGHYMVFYIKKQTKGINNANVPVAGSLSNNGEVGLIGGSTDFSTAVQKTVSQTATGIVSQIINSLFNSTPTGQTYRNDSAATANLLKGSIKNKQGAAAFLSEQRKTVLTKDSIALYMPDTLMYSYTQSYESLSPGKTMMGQIGAQLGGTGGTASEFKDRVKDLAATAAAIANLNIEKKFGSDFTKIATYKAIGGIVNPMLEVIYSSPAFRQFRFDFSFFPRSKTEALMIQNIIERFRFHQAPDLATQTSSAILVPPSEFDIKFYYAGSINPNIDSIGNCVLTSIDVNYAPNGFQSYEMPGEDTPTWGGTGMPVEIQLSLNFQETVILTKSDFQSSYSGSPTQTAPSVDTTPRQNGIGQGLNPAGAQFGSTPGNAATFQTKPR
jgi:hypothetical protein